MTPEIEPERLAALHAAAFAPSRGWSVAEFADFLAEPACELVTHPQGFALARVTLDEAELLTIATDAAHRRQGVARTLLAELLASVQARGAKVIFLEVAADNAAARALYDAAGFTKAGRRSGYYPRPGAAQVDALVLRKTLTAGETAYRT